MEYYCDHDALPPIGTPIRDKNNYLPSMIDGKTFDMLTIFESYGILDIKVQQYGMDIFV